jgi:hypothetical protein
MGNTEFHGFVREVEHCERLRMLFLYAAAPVFRGLKPGAMVALPAKCLHGWIENREGLLADTGLRCMEMSLGQEMFTLLLYDAEALADALCGVESAAVLRGRGYMVPEAALETADAGARIRLTETHLLPMLRVRYQLYKSCPCRRADFPHEVGLFLGYPAEDVAAFIENDGRGYALNAHWKVYHDTESARRICGKIDEARAEAADRIVKNYLERKES